MTFLPIVERELRVASRRKSTYRFRSLAATSALLLGGFYLMIFGGFSSSRSTGPILFTTLSWILFALCVCAGVLLGADSISEERREGTLGLLFLTDLKGFDVVLGKFFGASLNAFYSLFAAIPVLALPIMIGGVTGGEYWRVLLALTNALFFAFAVSIFISARCTESSKALAWATTALLIFVVLIPLLPISFRHFPASLATACLASPFAPFIRANDARYFFNSNEYWLSLGISHFLAWCFILWTCFAVTRTITSKGGKAIGFRSDSALGKFFRHLARRNRGLLDTNPIVWLLDAPLLRRMLMFVAIVLVAVLVIGAASGYADEVAYGGAVTFYLLILGMKPVVAAQACRFFGNSRRDGTWELLRSSPLPDEHFMNGQWSALIRTFWPPFVLMFVGALVIMGCASITKMNEGVVFLLYFGFKAFTGFYAVSWFAIWMSLTTRTPMRALGTTVLFSIALPTVLFCVPDAISDVLLIAIASTRARTLRTSVIGIRQRELEPLTDYRF